MNELEKKLPWTDWYVGWHLNPIGKSTHGRRTIEHDFYTAGVLGGVGVNDPEHKWSTRFTYPHHWEFIGCRFLSCGCTIAFSYDDQTFESVVLAPEKGIIVGELTKGADLAFFSLEHTFRAMGDVLIAELDKLKILQAKKTTDTHMRFVMVIAEGSQVDLEAIAHPYLESSAFDLWNNELEKRRRFLGRYEDEKLREMVNFSSESFYSALNPPKGKFVKRWLNTGDTDTPGFNTELLLPTIDFFNQTDPELAGDIYDGILEFQDDAGGIPAFCIAEGLFRHTAFTWPTLCQCAEILMSDERQHTRLQGLMPKLELYMGWLTKYYFQSDPKIPCWNTHDEAFIPEVFQQNMATPCLATLLILETESYQVLCRKLDYSASSFDSKGFLNKLTGLLAEFFWDKQKNNYRSQSVDGTPTAFPTLSNLVPLIWKNLPENRRDAVLKQFENPAGFNTYQGTALWLDETGNAEVAPVSGLHLFLLYYYLDKNQTLDNLPSRGRDFLKSIAKEFDPQIGLTSDLRYIFHHSLEAGEATSASTFIGTAAFICLLANLELKAPTPIEEASAPVAAMEEHRKLTSTGIISIIVLTVAIISGVFILKAKLTSSQYETLSGLAIKQFENGNYEDAVKSYRKLVKTTEDDIQQLMIMRLASCYIKQEDFTAALELYDKLYKEDFLNPKMMLNMGLCYYHAENLVRSKEIYEEFLSIYEDSHPEYAERAKTAIALLNGEKIK